MQQRISATCTRIRHANTNQINVNQLYTASGGTFSNPRTWRPELEKFLDLCRVQLDATEAACDTEPHSSPPPPTTTTTTTTTPLPYTHTRARTHQSWAAHWTQSQSSVPASTASRCPSQWPVAAARANPARGLHGVGPLEHSTHSTARSPGTHSQQRLREPAQLRVVHGRAAAAAAAPAAPPPAPTALAAAALASRRGLAGPRVTRASLMHAVT